MTSATPSTLTFTPFDISKCLPQTQSPLFSSIPPEIRNRIFSLALAEYEDLSAAYPETTCYRRPDYTAPRRTSTTLLRTCQLIYREAWFRPFTSATATLWLGAEDRRPSHVTTIDALAAAGALVSRVHGEPVQIDGVHVFAQLYKLEDPQQLNRVFDAVRHAPPRTFTITIRHTDWWWWESDKPLAIKLRWGDKCEFPSSVQVLRIELESLERKKGQVDEMARKMREQWRFVRKDGTLLAATGSDDVNRWSGSSTWNGERWLRDETRPDVLDYYVRTVVFRPATSVCNPTFVDSVASLPALLCAGQPIGSNGGAAKVSLLNRVGVPGVLRLKPSGRCVQPGSSG